MAKEIELSQALSAKICHDLAGAVGTIDNCLNLLENDNDTIRTKAKSLVFSESENLINRIRFFRSAYGSGEGDDKMSIVGITKLIKDFLQASDVALNMKLEDGILYIDSMLAKAVISLSSIASDNIGGRGEVKIEIVGDNDNVSVMVSSIGNSLSINEESLKILSNGARSKVNVKNCREHYIKSILSKHNYKVSVSMDSDTTKYSIIKK